MTRGITFKSVVPDKAEWDKDEILIKPAGCQHMTAIRSCLSSSISMLGEPWNEEDYAWEFQVLANGVTVSIIVGAVDDEWRIQILPVVFLGFLRRKRVCAALDLVTNAVESFLKSDARFSDVCRSDDEI